jgi:hypothetical protein
MSFRVRGKSGRVLVLCLGLTGVASTARAQDVLPSPAPSLLRTAPPDAILEEPSRETGAVASRGVLIPMYVTFASLQMLDAHSTLRAVNAGAVEQNPLMRGLADRPVALVALKAGVAASTIVLADKMRGRSRVGAVVMMAALNSAYAMVVAHNYRTVPSLR